MSDELLVRINDDPQDVIEMNTVTQERFSQEIKLGKQWRVSPPVVDLDTPEPSRERSRPVDKFDYSVGVQLVGSVVLYVPSPVTSN